ncbi:hypothetical protein EON63_16925 [archaeon]|nr:MAG: hypothetical protein EON63_16925 [archaeon]
MHVILIPVSIPVLSRLFPVSRLSQLAQYYASHTHTHEQPHKHTQHHTPMPTPTTHTQTHSYTHIHTHTHSKPPQTLTENPNHIQTHTILPMLTTEQYMQRVHITQCANCEELTEVMVRGVWYMVYSVWCRIYDLTVNMYYTITYLFLAYSEHICLLCYPSCRYVWS